MASSEDFERILELYNQESKTSGVSIVAFCQKNGIASRVAQILNKMKILKAIWAFYFYLFVPRRAKRMPNN